MQRDETLIRRRGILIGMASMTALAGCSTVASRAPMPGEAMRPMGPPSAEELAARYAELKDGDHTLPAIPYQQIDPRLYRQRVRNTTGEPAGTVVVDTPSNYLYVVEPGGTAMRYGVGLGRAGFAWEGEGVIHWRQKWPRWKPPEEMIARQPSLRKYSVENGGQAPGPDNPLGARALYIFQNGQDTLYRLHGTREWSSIGKSVSSGCVRLINQDVIDLYERVPNKARIVVRQ
ncbi:L,D-transpeptidase [Allorhizobium borbori]|uniref:Lipoprotein-anchoring transpeptidase ErfK/SrfK n=1 Tax=Allorhizobium borbori TaxID=485907 RepID=A0A7W6K069_9HYPH|nr:L,D-transpeptidase [Allorhizobium borbori]MBB4101672.1 lipoprotein-anchoring transpeptidase ErfK/SrfK [Allorhizobium borbori]PZU21775.1 MAG: hypothetical protein DI589_12725 [Shinella sp.]